MHLLLPAVLLLNAAHCPSSDADATDYLVMSYFAGSVGGSALAAWRQTEALYAATLKSQDLTSTAWQVWWQRNSLFTPRHADPTPQQLEQLGRTSSWPAQLSGHMGDAVRDL